MDTFVLRIWAPADVAGPSPESHGTRGTAHHIGSGRSGIFRDDKQLIRLLDELRRQGGTGKPGADDASASGRSLEAAMADDGVRQ